jgi:hypothetical protein
MRRSSSSSSSTTSSEVNNYDQRSVVDNTGGIFGSGNQVDNSLTVIDSRTITQTDAGAVRASMDALTNSLSIGFDGLEGIGAQNQRSIERAFDSADLQSMTAREAILSAFDLQGDAQRNSRETYASALSYADSALNAATNAYKTNADSSSGNRTVILAAIAVVGIVGAGLIFRRGAK